MEVNCHIFSTSSYEGYTVLWNDDDQSQSELSKSELSQFPGKKKWLCEAAVFI